MKTVKLIIRSLCWTINLVWRIPATAVFLLFSILFSFSLLEKWASDDEDFINYVNCLRIMLREIWK